MQAADSLCLGFGLPSYVRHSMLVYTQHAFVIAYQVFICYCIPRIHLLLHTPTIQIRGRSHQYY